MKLNPLHLAATAAALLLAAGLVGCDSDDDLDDDEFGVIDDRDDAVLAGDRDDLRRDADALVNDDVLDDDRGVLGDDDLMNDRDGIVEDDGVLDGDVDIDVADDGVLE